MFLAACLDYAQDWMVYVALGLAVALVLALAVLLWALRELRRSKRRRRRLAGDDWPHWTWPTDETAH